MRELSKRDAPPRSLIDRQTAQRDHSVVLQDADFAPFAYNPSDAFAFAIVKYRSCASALSSDCAIGPR